MHPRPANQASPGSSAPPTDPFWKRRPQAARILACLILAAFATAWLLLQSPNFFSGYDFMRMHFFYKSYYREALLGGRLPLWNPYVGLGRPFMSDIETATLYPPTLLVLAFGVTGGVVAEVILHQALAIYGGVRLGRFLGASETASWIAGVGYAAAGPFVARLDVGIIEGYFSLCWLPCLLWLGARLQDGWNPRVAGAFAVSVGLAVLAGQPPLLYVEFLGLALFLAGRLTWPKNAAGWRRAAADNGGVMAAFALGLGLASAELLPFLELVGQGNRPLQSTGFAIANGMPAASWLSLLIPTQGGFAPNWEYGIYCGAVPLFAALIGLGRMRERNVRALVFAGLVGALLAAGDRAPFLRWATHVLPGAGALRIPSRYGILAAVSVLGLSAVGLTRPGPRSGLGVLFAAAASLGSLLWLRPHVGADGAEAVHYFAGYGAPLFLGAGVLGLWLVRGRWPLAAVPAALALALFCACDWARAIHLEAPVYSEYGFPVDDAELGSQLARSGLRTPGGVPPRVSFHATDIRENAGMIQGFSSYNSYVAPSLSRPWAYLHAAAEVPLSGSDFIRLPDAICTRYLRLDGINLTANFDRAAHAVAVWTPGDPRAYVAFDAEVVPDWSKAMEVMALRRDFHRRALLERDTAPAFSAPPGSPQGSASVESFLPEEVTVRTQASAPGLLVLAEAWYPGWTASIGGVPARVFPVNGWMRGVVVPAGASTVTFRYCSRFLIPGLAVSLACAAAAAALLARRRSAQTDSRIL